MAANLREYVVDAGHLARIFRLPRAAFEVVTSSGMWLAPAVVASSESEPGVLVVPVVSESFLSNAAPDHRLIGPLLVHVRARACDIIAFECGVPIASPGRVLEWNGSVLDASPPRGVATAPIVAYLSHHDLIPRFERAVANVPCADVAPHARGTSYAALARMEGPHRQDPSDVMGNLLRAAAASR